MSYEVGHSHPATVIETQGRCMMVWAPSAPAHAQRLFVNRVDVCNVGDSGHIEYRITPSSGLWHFVKETS